MHIHMYIFMYVKKSPICYASVLTFLVNMIILVVRNVYTNKQFRYLYRRELVLQLSIELKPLNFINQNIYKILQKQMYEFSWTQCFFIACVMSIKTLFSDFPITKREDQSKSTDILRCILRDQSAALVIILVFDCALRQCRDKQSSHLTSSSFLSTGMTKYFVATMNSFRRRNVSHLTRARGNVEQTSFSLFKGDYSSYFIGTCQN